MSIAGDDVGRVGGACGGDGGGRVPPVPPLASEAGDGPGAQHVVGGGPPDGHRAPGAVPAVVPRLPRALAPVVVPAAAAAAGRRGRGRSATTASRGGDDDEAAAAASPHGRLGWLRLDGVRPEQRMVQTVLLVRRHAVDGVAVHALKSNKQYPTRRRRRRLHRQPCMIVNQETDRQTETKHTVVVVALTYIDRSVPAN